MSDRLLLAVVLALVSLGGCERTFRDMYDQSRYKPLAASGIWADGRASRPPPDGAIARSEGTFAGTSSGRLGTIVPDPRPGPFDTVRPELRENIVAQASAPAQAIRASTTPQALARGRERFDIYCSPCHSIAGDGDGMVARRGFPHPPSFHIERLRNAPDEHLYAVITNGYGAMHSYATRVSAQDRLAIIGYIRALQLSQHAPAAVLSGQDRAKLDAAATAPPGQPGAPR